MVSPASAVSPAVDAPAVDAVAAVPTAMSALAG